jgi:hypothetical protein
MYVWHALSKQLIRIFKPFFQQFPNPDSTDTDYMGSRMRTVNFYCGALWCKPERSVQFKVKRRFKLFFL